MTTQYGQYSPAADESAKTWKGRARRRWKITAALGVTTIVLFFNVNIHRYTDRSM